MRRLAELNLIFTLRVRVVYMYNMWICMYVRCIVCVYSHYANIHFPRSILNTHGLSVPRGIPGKTFPNSFSKSRPLKFNEKLAEIRPSEFPSLLLHPFATLSQSILRGSALFLYVTPF